MMISIKLNMTHSLTSHKVVMVFMLPVNLMEVKVLDKH